MRLLLLVKFPVKLIVLPPKLSVLPVPTDRFPAIFHVTVNEVGEIGKVMEQVPAPLVPNERLPLTVHIKVPVGGPNVQDPEVLSKDRLPYVLPEKEEGGEMVLEPRRITVLAASSVAWPIGVAKELAVLWMYVPPAPTDHVPV